MTLGFTSEPRSLPPAELTPPLSLHGAARHDPCISAALMGLRPLTRPRHLEDKGILLVAVPKEADVEPLIK